MESTKWEWGEPADPRRSAARRYTLALNRLIGQAVYEGTLGGYGITDAAEGATRKTDSLFAAAERLAENGLLLLERCCEGKLAGGWAERIIGTIASLNRNWGDQPPDILVARAIEYFDDAFVALEASLPPEGRMPKLIYSPSHGLSRDAESKPCRVTLQGSENSNLGAILDGVELEPPLSLRSYRALTLIIENDIAGGGGLTMEQLGDCRVEVSELAAKEKETGRPRYPHWDAVIFRPGTRRRTGCPGRYGIKPAQSSQAA